MHHGNLFDVLPTFDAASIDACVTDPPYDLSFMGKAWDRTGVAFQAATWREVIRVLKPGGHLVAFGGTRTSHRMVCAIEDAGFEIRDALCWLYGQGFPKSLNLGDGRGTALKPAHEPIALAWKPFKGSITANVAAHGTGALNIDACRIEGDVPSCTQGQSRQAGTIYGTDQRDQREFVGHELGRWPANVLLDDEAAVLLDAQTGDLGFSSGTEVAGEAHPSGIYGSRIKEGRGQIGIGDRGGGSRFYYVAKPSREERDFGCEALARISAATITGRKEGSAGLQNPRAGIRAGSMDRDTLERAARNTHPTVKPVELMRWLVRLVTPPGGTVLDPFAGSGTTGMACRYEQRRFIGIEREAEYAAIADRRIAAVAPLFGDA